MASETKVAGEYGEFHSLWPTAARFASSTESAIVAGMPEKVVLSWSGGKGQRDGAPRLLATSRYEVVGLLTSVAEEYKRISHHGVREELLDAAGRRRSGSRSISSTVPSDGGPKCRARIEHYEKLMRDSWCSQSRCDSAG